MFTRVMTIGDGAFVWSATTVLATVRTGDDALRTIHDDGTVVAWSAAGAPRVCVRTRETRHAAWVDDRLFILEHTEPPELELRAIDEPTPRWTVRVGGSDPRAIIVLPCKTMFYRDGLGRWSSTIHSLADGSALEETIDRWVAIGRHATYRCVFHEEKGPVLRTWYDTEGTEMVEVGPSTCTWRLDHDGRTLLEAAEGTDGFPSRAWIADDDTSITMVIRHRIVVRSLPDLRPLVRPTPEPKVVAAPTPLRFFSCNDVAEVPSRASIKARWGIEVSIYEHFLDRDRVLSVASGRGIRHWREGSPAPFATHTIAWRGTHVLAALGGTVALVTDLSVDSHPGWKGPATAQLRVLALDPGVDEPRLVRVLSEWRWSESRGSRALLAVSSDDAIGIDSAVTDPVVRVWDIASGALVQTIDLSPDDDRVQHVAFGEGHRFFVATTRGRVFGYAAE